MALYIVAAPVLGAQPGLRVDGRLVLVNAGGYDDPNRFHDRLTQENFQLLDEGIEMQLDSVAAEELPLSTVSLFDVGRSIEKNIAGAGEALGRGTARNDALLDAVAIDKRASNPRRAILILSDGLDNTSTHGWNEVRRVAMETDAVLYAVSLPARRGRDAAKIVRLEEFPEESGAAARHLRVYRRRQYSAKVH